MTRSRLVLCIALVLAAGCKKSKPEGEQGSAAGSDEGSGTGEQKPKGKTIAANGAALDNASALSVGPDKACALVEEKAWCWEPGQPAAQVTTPTGLTAIAAATCGLTTDNGDLFCWGDKEIKSAADALGGQVTSSAGGVCTGHRMAIKCWHVGDAAPYADFAWAGVDKIVHGDHKLCSAVAGGSVECVDLAAKEWKNEAVSGPHDVNVLAMAGNLSCGQLNGGKVECWVDPDKRKEVPSIKDASDVALGPTGDACAITGNGFVSCWKTDGTATTVEASVKPINGVRGASAIGVGNGFGCAIVTGDKVVCWGKASKEPETAQGVAKK
jgi:hypothetical protein